MNVIENILLFILGILLPVKLYVALVGLVLFVDTIYGILAARKLKEKFSLKKLFDGIVKKMFNYTTIVVTVYYLDMQLLNDLMKMFIPIDGLITKVAVMTVLMKEITSIDENFKTVTNTSIFAGILKLFKHYKKVKKEITE